MVIQTRDLDAETPHPLGALVSKNWIYNEWVILEVFL